MTERGGAAEGGAEPGAASAAEGGAVDGGVIGGRTASDRATAAAFGRRVAEYREGLGWTQSDLARETGLSQSGLSFIEAGTRTPSIETARVIAAALGVSVGVLLGEPGAALVGEEAQFLADWRSASARIRGEVVRYLRFLRQPPETRRR